MKRPIPLIVAAAALATAPLATPAATVYTSEAAFIAAAGAAKASLPASLVATPSFTAAPLTFQSDSGQTFVINTSLYGQAIPGEDNLLLNGYESHTLTSAVPLYAFGFRIFQPSNANPSPGPNGVACYAACDSGPFTVSLFLGATPVANFSFTAAFNTVEFHGYAGTAAFARIRIDDTLRTIDDEYFSTYRYSATPVPEPGTWALLLGGLGLLGFAARRRRL